MPISRVEICIKAGRLLFYQVTLFILGYVLLEVKNYFLELPLLNSILLCLFQVLVIINLVALIWVSLFIFRGKCLFSIDMILIAVMLNWIVFWLNLVKVKRYFNSLLLTFTTFVSNLGFDLHSLESLLYFQWVIFAGRCL